MQATEFDEQARVLDPVDRTSEVVFGLLMAMSFVGSLSVAKAGHEEVRTMMVTALGCNLAWGIVDAVMYLLRIRVERTRGVNLLNHLAADPDATHAQALISDALPPRLAAAASPEVLEMMRLRLIELPVQKQHARLGAEDFKGALGVFLLVVLATFPVVVPFMLLDSAHLAVRVSNLVALAMLFVAGSVLMRYAGGSSWRGGVTMLITGVALMAAIMALGG
ncbi:VIT1/CCC1 transporter family protein [Silvimonas sp.]|uniref:VIT1/CCC1 transporter family protein n=1 Tax=Silvimonas sp. TaxID=2650811 RepID=UPI0028441AF9|nr:VIT1/CCC1 transporter family protein [Silvimonas sp.]MDR3427518.1 VIT1/CCC1 transporter family protein [Silvimonas sp.]